MSVVHGRKDSVSGWEDVDDSPAVVAGYHLQSSLRSPGRSPGSTRPGSGTGFTPVPERGRLRPGGAPALPSPRPVSAVGASTITKKKISGPGARPQSQHQWRAARPAPLLTESTDGREDVFSYRPSVDDEQRQAPPDPAGAMRFDSGSSRKRKEELRLQQLKQLSNSRALQPWLRSQHRARTPVSLLEATAVHGLSDMLAYDVFPTSASDHSGTRSRKMSEEDKLMHLKERQTHSQEKFAHLKNLSDPAALMKRFEPSSSHSYQIIDAEINIDLGTDTCHVCGGHLSNSALSRTAARVQEMEGTRIDATHVPRIPQNLQHEDAEWEAKWSNILLTEMSNFFSVEVFCSAMLMQMDLNFPEAGKDADQPNYLRVAASLDMLDVIIPVLGSFKPVMSRLRDEIVRGIYMPDKSQEENRMSEDARKRSTHLSMSSRKTESSRTRTARPMSGNTTNLGSRSIESSSEAARTGASYFSRTPYFRSGIRTASDIELIRGMDEKIKALEAKAKELQLQVTELELEKTSLEKRIEGFQLRTQTMETEIEVNAKKWAKKETAFIKEIDVLTEKLDASFVQLQQAGHSGDADSAAYSHAGAQSHAGALLPHAPTASMQSRQAAPAIPMSVQDAEAAEKQLEQEKVVIGIIRSLANGLIDLSRKEAQGACADMRATTKRFENTPTVRMLLKHDETCQELDRVSRLKTQELLTRWISAHLKQALNDGKLPDGATIVISNLTTDLDDGMVLLNFINLVLPEHMKWPDERVSTARSASLEKRGSLFAQTMVDLTADPQWEEVDLFGPGDGTLDVRIRYLSLLYLLSSNLSSAPWGAGQQLASNYNKMQETADHIGLCADKLLQVLDAADVSNEPLFVLSASTGASLCEAVKGFEANSAEVRSRIADADAELHEMCLSTHISRTAVVNLYSTKTNLQLKDELEKNKNEFERGQEEGFEEAKRQGLIHAQMQRATGQTQEFSRGRLKSGFAKLLLGNLNNDRFQDIIKPEFQRGLNPEHFVRWMEQCASTTLHHSTAVFKVFRCYARLRESADHPDANGISIRLEQFLSLLHTAELLQTDVDYSREKISPLKAVHAFRMACREKYFHVVEEDSSKKLADVLKEVQQEKDNTLKMSNFIEALARISWRIIRQISPTTISHSTLGNVFTQVATRCDQLDVDHFLANTSANSIKELLRPVVDTALRKYAGTDAWPRKSKRSMAPSEFATLLKACKVYNEIGSDAVGWCFWRVDHDIDEEEEEWGSGTEEAGNRRLAPTALHRALCYVSQFLVPDPLVPLNQKVMHMLDQYLAPRLLPTSDGAETQDKDHKSHHGHKHHHQHNHQHHSRSRKKSSVREGENGSMRVLSASGPDGEEGGQAAEGE